MKLFTGAILKKLFANGAAQKGNPHGSIDFYPVVKLFLPVGGATWLFTKLDPDDPDLLFGLCDLGLGFPELGDTSRREIESVVGKMGLKIERDLFFKADKPLSAYAEEARQQRHICA